MDFSFIDAAGIIVSVLIGFSAFFSFFVYTINTTAFDEVIMERKHTMFKNVFRDLLILFLIFLVLAIILIMSVENPYLLIIIVFLIVYLCIRGVIERLKRDYKVNTTICKKMQLLSPKKEIKEYYSKDFRLSWANYVSLSLALVALILTYAVFIYAFLVNIENLVEDSTRIYFNYTQTFFNILLGMTLISFYVYKTVIRYLSDDRSVFKLIEKEAVEESNKKTLYLHYTVDGIQIYSSKLDIDKSLMISAISNNNTKVYLRLWARGRGKDKVLDCIANLSNEKNQHKIQELLFDVYDYNVKKALIEIDKVLAELTEDKQ